MASTGSAASPQGEGLEYSRAAARWANSLSLRERATQHLTRSASLSPGRGSVSPRGALGEVPLPSGEGNAAPHPLRLPLPRERACCLTAWCARQKSLSLRERET